jgi:hypothetical protein
MLEFFRLYLHLFLEIASLLTGLICLKYLKNHKGFIYFIPFLLTTVVVECIAKYLLTSPNIDRSVRYMLFNIFTTCEFVFYSLIFLIYLKNKTLRRIITMVIPIYITLVILNISFIQGTQKFHSYTFLLGSFFMVVYSCFFLYESILPDSINIKLSQHPFFWVTIGLLIFYLGSVIINALFEYLTSAALGKQGTAIYSFINNSLNVVLYGSFIIAFILCRKNKKISSSPSL